jgi:CRP/FNR family transcriptional regulator
MGNTASPLAKPRQDRAITTGCADCEIRAIGVCSSLAPGELERMQRIVREAQYEEGQLIFSEGEPADNLFNVLTGAVRLIKLLPDGRRQITGFLFPGDFLGIALNATYAYSAEAITGTKLCRMGRRDIETLLARAPAPGRSGP